MILGIVQARVSSTRLPGKVLKPILGRPMIEHQLERLQRVRSIDKLMVATSDQPEDRLLVSLCGTLGVACFCGNLEDVLDRFYRAAQSQEADTVVRLTGDCPLADPEVVEEVITHFVQGDYDYVSNSLTPTYPDGLDVEVMTFRALETAWREARLASQREHVTPFIWQSRHRFRVANCANGVDLSHHRWTVDEPEDFELVTAVFEGLYHEQPEFGTNEVLSFLREHEGLSRLNRSHERNEGYAKSLSEDKVAV